MSQNPLAFPRPASVGTDYISGGSSPADSQQGMELRDYFAGQVIMGCCAGGILSDSDVQKMTRNAYAIADAMLEARVKP